MGRGRAKAKQTKVARQLKYSTSATDLDRLRAELQADSVGPFGAPAPEHALDDEDEDLDEDDPYAQYLEDDDVAEGGTSRH